MADVDLTDLSADPRPSEHFVRAVAQLLETDANDLLAELGYVPDEAIVVSAAR